jgi:hypothetical protein
MRFPDRFQATSPEAKVNTSFRQLTIKFLFENNCLDHSAQNKTQQHSEHPKHQTPQKIGDSEKDIAILPKPERLIGKCRERRVPATKASGKEKPVVRMNKGSILQERHEKAQNQTPANVDDESAEGEKRSQPFRSPISNKITSVSSAKTSKAND